MHNGVPVVEGCYYGSWMTEIIQGLWGHDEPQEEAAFHVLLERLGEPSRLSWVGRSGPLLAAVPGTGGRAGRSSCAPTREPRRRPAELRANGARATSSRPRSALKKRLRRRASWRERRSGARASPSVSIVSLIERFGLEQDRASCWWTSRGRRPTRRAAALTGCPGGCASSSCPPITTSSRRSTDRPALPGARPPGGRSHRRRADEPSPIAATGTSRRRSTSATPT